MGVRPPALVFATLSLAYIWYRPQWYVAYPSYGCAVALIKGIITSLLCGVTTWLSSGGMADVPGNTTAISPSTVPRAHCSKAILCQNDCCAAQRHLAIDIYTSEMEYLFISSGGRL